MKRSHEEMSEEFLGRVSLSGIYLFHNVIGVLHDIAKGNKNAEVLIKLNQNGISIGHMDASMTFGALTKIKLDSSLNEVFTGTESTTGLKLQDLRDAVSLIHSKDSFKGEGIRVTAFEDRLEIDVIENNCIVFNLAIKSLSDTNEEIQSTFTFENKQNIIQEEDDILEFEITDRILASEFVAKEKDTLVRLDLGFSKTLNTIEKKSIRIRSSTHVGLAFDTKTIGDANCDKGFTKYVIGEKWGSLVKIFKCGQILFSDKYLVFELENDMDSVILLLTYSIEP